MQMCSMLPRVVKLPCNGIIITKNNNEPYKASAHTAEGLETSSAAVFAFVRGTDGLSLAIILDRPSDGSGGDATLSGTCTGDSCDDFVYLLGDDPGEGPQNINGETPFSGNWHWLPCCTDGAVLGHFGGCQTMHLQLSGLNNVDIAVFASSLGGTNWEIAATDVATAPFNFTFGETCPDPEPVSDCVCDNFAVGNSCTSSQITTSNQCACISFDAADSAECNPVTPASTSDCAE
jgi:hypothetical protein